MLLYNRLVLLILRWALAGAALVALSSLLSRGWWRRTPVFCCYLAAGLIALALHIELERWLVPSWLTWQVALSALRAAAAIEILLAAGIGIRIMERLAVAGFGALGACGLALLANFYPASETIYYQAAAVMAQAEAAIIIGIAAGFIALWRLDIKADPFIARHAALFIGLMANQFWTARAKPDTEGLWRVQHAAYLLIAIALLACWACVVLRRPAAANPSPLASGARQ